MEVNILPYHSGYHEAFRQLNLEWLNHYQLAESHDLMILDDPEGTVIKNGGNIWMAVVDGVPVGSAAIINEGHGEYELAKMTVAPEFRGKGISKLLIDQCLAKAKENGAKKISLFSNSRLKTAIALYEKYGFRHVALVNSPFATADVRMELFF